MSKSKAAKVTDEHREEARQLRSIWERTGHGGLNQTEFGERHGIGSQAAVGFFLNGKSALSMNAAKGFAAGLRCQISDFSPRLAKIAEEIAAVSTEQPDFMNVKRLDVRLSAGTGAVEELYEEVGGLQFRRDFLVSCGINNPENANVVGVKGTSMEPTIMDGAVLLVNRVNREPRTGKIFALAKANDGLVVKRLVKLKNGSWVARSDNPDGNPDFPINDGEPVSVLGAACWMGVKL